LWPGERKFGDGSAAENLYTFFSPTIWVMLVAAFLALLGSYKIFLRLEPNFAREL
jgi:hypothetical protein